METARMKNFILAVMTVPALAVPLDAGQWYSGDGRCLPPKDDGTYSAPYKASDHPDDFPTFNGADKPGWSCSYQRPDGVIVQYGDSRTPQEQWLSFWSPSKRGKR
jgi:hypothetical protein